MKEIAGVLACASIAMFTQAQEKSEYRPGLDFVRTKTTLPPAVRLLDESQRWFVEYPQELTYHKVKRGNEIWGINNLGGVDVKAKKAKKAEEADIIFRVTSPGIKIMPAAPSYIKEDIPRTFYTPAASIKGYVYRFRYYMPVTVEVLNKQGVVEKTFHFNTDTGTSIYHANYFLDARSTEAYQPVKMTAPFAQETDAVDAFKKNEAAVYARMEYNTWYGVMETADKALELAYARYELPLLSFAIKTLNKKGRTDFATIDELVKRQIKAMEELKEEKKAAAAMDALKQSAADFDGLVASLNSYESNIQHVILANATWAALLTGQTKKAADYYQQYLKLDRDGHLTAEFETLYPYYYEWDSIAQPTPAVKPVENAVVVKS